MSELISLLIGTVVMYVLFTQIREYNELIRHKFRFRYFALRDRLAMLVVSGEIKEDSWEYKHIVNTLNFHISAVEHMSVMYLINRLVSYHTSPKEERSVQQLSNNVDNSDVALILVEYMSTTLCLIKRNSRAQIFVLNKLANFRNQRKNVSHSKHQIVVNPDSALSAITSRKSAFQSHLAAV